MTNEELQDQIAKLKAALATISIGIAETRTSLKEANEELGDVKRLQLLAESVVLELQEALNKSARQQVNEAEFDPLDADPIKASW